MGKAFVNSSNEGFTRLQTTLPIFAFLCTLQANATTQWVAVQ